jgi:hypothetical protein
MTPLNKLAKALLLSTLSAWAVAGIVHAAPSKPKYGPEAVPLSQSHEYFRANAAPDYWALSPYYMAQQDGRSCSVASVAMVINGARADLRLTSDDELVTQPSVLKRANDETWSRGVGALGRGVTLDQLKVAVEKSLKGYGITAVSVEAVHTDDSSARTLSALRQALIENEKSAGDFIILNFDQGVYTGDTPAGHIAPLGAYDAKKKRVLVMDPDRQWFEPYWVSDETLLKGMATLDKEAGRSRGYVVVKLKK